MAQLDLKKTIKGKNFFTRKLFAFGGKQKKGDQSVFDSRGAITITDQDHTKRNGEVIKIRAVKDAGGSSMAITRPSGAGNMVDPARAMDAYKNWAYAATKAIADEVAGIEFKVFKIKNGGEYEEILEHPLLDLLESVNDQQTGPEFRYTLATHLELTGNAYILLEDVKTFEAPPKSMYLLDPSKVKVCLNKVTYPWVVSGYKFTIETREFSYQPYEIVQLKYPNPGNPYIGSGTVDGIAQWIDNDNASSTFLSQFFRNGAQLGVIFETDMAAEEQLQELRDSFNEQHSGVDNFFKGLFLPKGVKKPSTGEKFNDIGFADVSTANRDKILAGFRVSKTILGAAESETNRATAETADFVFAKRTIKPKMLLINSYLNEFLVPRFGDDIFLTFTDPVPENQDQKSTEMQRAIGQMPVMTVNEARKRYLDLEEIDGGDKLLAPNTMIPATDAGQFHEFTALGVKIVRKTTGKIAWFPTKTKSGKTQFSRNAKIRKEISETLADKILKIVTRVQKKSVNDMHDAEYEEVVLKAKRSRNDKYTIEMRDELVKLNNVQKEEVMKNLDDATKAFNPATKVFDVSKLFNKDRWIALTISTLTPTVQKLFKKEADLALELIDEPGLDVENTPAAKEAIANAMSLMSESYTLDTVALLETKITEGLEQGMGSFEMAELVSDVYEFKNQVAAERVARTESNRITNEAGKIAWKESGVVKEIKWVTLGEDSACEFCRALNGKTISIEKNFYNIGDTIKGDEGGTLEVTYSDVGAPPAHPNCRCDTKPVVTKKIMVAEILGK